MHRIEQQLQMLGCTVAVFSTESAATESIAAQVRSFSPDIVHAFHAARCGGLAAELAAENNTRYLITMTGTDMYGSTGNGASCCRLTVANGAAALVFFTATMKESFLRAHPELTMATAVIPQGVVVPDTVAAEPPENQGFYFLLPAGIRAVKNLLLPLTPLAKLQRRYPHTRLLLAGGIIEPEYAARLLAAVKEHPFACWLGEVPFDRMAQLYCSAHVVMNSSLSEGGMANSLLEGMAFGRALLATDIEGNRSLVSDGETGFLFRDADDLVGKAELLLRDRGLRQRMGTAGRAYVSSHCSPALEAERYLELYSLCR